MTFKQCALVLALAISTLPAQADFADRDLYVAGICVLPAADLYPEPSSPRKIAYMLDCTERAKQRSDAELHDAYCAVIRAHYATPDPHCP